ncbi:unnamed protein product [Gongylonema pulchrum]|uniref:MOSC domain-containing protein n=1 Tax=Gongylonema pulchrum TaxID=637853 RepID=A0A183CW53_9BILA|nr:unnamed protein product [Gongylonema pulchrum]
MGLSRKEWLILGASCATSAVVLHYTAKFVRQYIKDRKHPYVTVGQVSELYIYPLESCRGRQVNSMICEEYGGKHEELEERHFVMVDMRTKAMITALTHPRLVLVDCDVTDGVLTLTTPESTPIRVNIHKVVKENKIITYNLCENVKRSGLDCGTAAAEWCTRTLQIVAPVKLLYCVDGLAAQPSILGKCLNAWSQYQNQCVRLTPYISINQESLNNLNSHSESDGVPATTRHFRPSIVIDECEPYDEDKWMEIRIGNCEFDCFEPCARLLFTLETTIIMRHITL